MGRVKSKYPKGSFYLKDANAKGEASIYLRYYIINKYVKKSTGILIKPADWNEQGQCIKSSNKMAALYNNKLQSVKNKIDEQIIAYEGRLTPKVVEEMMSGRYQTSKEIVANTDFTEYALKYNEECYAKNKIGFTTYDNSRLNILAFRKFIASSQTEPILYLDKLNVDVFNAYIQWRIHEKGNKSYEGINKTLTPLYKAVQYASDNELISPKIASVITNNYLELKDRKYNSEVEDEQVNYLTEKQIQEFVNLYPQVKYDTTRDIMDMFLFSFYACGLRVSDIITLEWKHIDLANKKLTKNLVKGKKYYEIPLTDSALAILHKWRSYDRNDRFVFDRLRPNFDLFDEAQFKTARLSKNRVIQQSLKTVGMKMNLPFNLTMHVARHTFAVLALSRGVTIHLISRLMGHSSILVTETIYAKFLPDTINEEVKSKLSFNFTPQSIED